MIIALGTLSECVNVCVVKIHGTKVEFLVICKNFVVFLSFQNCSRYVGFPQLRVLSMLQQNVIFIFLYFHQQVVSTNLDSRNLQSSNLINIVGLTIRKRCRLKQFQGTPNYPAGQQQTLCFNCLTVSERGPEWQPRQVINELKIHEIHVMFRTRPLHFVKYSKKYKIVNTTCIRDFNSSNYYVSKIVLEFLV